MAVCRRHGPGPLLDRLRPPRQPCSLPKSADDAGSTDDDRTVLTLATPDDLPFLWMMLTEAASPPGTPRPDDPLGDDHVSRYLAGWGRPGDVGLVARIDGCPVGASWLRLMPPDAPGYGFVDETTPELGVAVVEAHRGAGVGRVLVAGLLDVAAAVGHEQVSLSVARTNPGAASLYRSLGFVAVGSDGGGSETMAAPSTPVPPPAPSSRSQFAPSVRAATAADGPALLRLREVMHGSVGRGGVDGWHGPFLDAWGEGHDAGRWIACVVDDGCGRPVASALADLSPLVPGPGREDGRAAHIGSVATEPAWRRQGLARAAVADLVARLDAAEIPRATLSATPDAVAIYEGLGFIRRNGVPMHRTRPKRV